jgi:hypothetical protein
MRSHLFFQIVSNFFQIGVFGGLRYHDFFKTISRFFQMDFLIVIGGTSYEFWIAN